MQRIEFRTGLQAGPVKGKFGQQRQRAAHIAQRSAMAAIEHHQAFDDQLAQDAQRRRDIPALREQLAVGSGHGGAVGQARGEQRPLRVVASVQALVQAGMGGRITRSGSGLGDGWHGG